MFNELFNIAKNKLASIDEIPNGLPDAQVTVILTENGNLYTSVNDIEGLICKELQINKDTKIIRMLTMWKSGDIDLASIKFRKALVELDEENVNTDVILQGKDDCLVKKMVATL